MALASNARNGTVGEAVNVNNMSIISTESKFNLCAGFMDFVVRISGQVFAVGVIES